MMTEALCKGAWSLGTACGKCERCRDEAVKMAPTLIAKAETLAKITFIARAADKRSREFANACVEEIYRILTNSGELRR